ncbi:MAG TPA: hypothetical protein PK598_15785 [Thermoanaerobaculia bacterium]|nr:hypothetical protein [Thermoanaerobaculia bacterium]
MTAPARSPSRLSVLVLAGLAVAAAFGFVLCGLGGLDYYLTPLALRGTQKVHRLLRPSGTAGLVLGIAGMGLMLLTLPFVVRKKIPALSRRGSTQRWLDFHIFCGIVGPALITLHTSFKFNGIISVAYWSMVLVVSSGFVGRYLYVRIPRSIRGVELSLDEIQERIDDLKRRAEEAAAAARGTHAMDAEISALDGERALLARRMKNLARTKKLFDLWHVFHKPLVYVMFTIAAVHVALAVYMGYSVHF